MRTRIFKSYRNVTAEIVAKVSNSSLWLSPKKIVFVKKSLWN